MKVKYISLIIECKKVPLSLVDDRHKLTVFYLNVAMDSMQVGKAVLAK